MSENILKACKKNASNRKKKQKYEILVQKVNTFINDPKVKEEAKSKGRKVSPADLSAEDESLHKSVRTDSPTKP